MTKHENIYSALCAAQKEFGQVTKGSTNPAFKSKYADLADVANVVIPALSDHGVAVMHYLIGDTLNTMRTEFVHAPSGSKVYCDVPLIVDRQNMQGMKSATTYAKRIGLESLSGIAPDDDDGNAAAKASPKEEKPAAPPQHAIDAAKQSLFNAANLDALKSIWTELPNDIRAVRDVENAKDARKAELDAAPKEQAAPDLGGDEIPEFGGENATS